MGKNLLHVDFYQVKKGEKIKMEIPIVIVGDAPAMKIKGRMLIHGITTLHVESLPEKIPAEIEVDISGLEDELRQVDAELGTMIDEALERGRRALSMLRVEGIATNADLHLRILDDPDFAAGRIDTHFMERFLEP